MGTDLAQVDQFVARTIFLKFFPAGRWVPRRLHFPYLNVRRLVSAPLSILGTEKVGDGKGAREIAGINRLGIGNERVLQGKLSRLLWPRTVRW